jgi:ABC-type spermidine/putrescine transport system permease subunit II
VLFILSPLIIIIGGSFTREPRTSFPPHATLRWYGS